MSPVPRVPKDYRGPALLSYGFRPFFLGGAAWAAVAVAFWLPQFYGELVLPSALAPLGWHIHEMLFGYVPAVVAGFLLTAIPNWTGRLPVAGSSLGALFALWLAGRIAVTFSSSIGVVLAGIIDAAFLATLAAVSLREIIVGHNWRNLRVLAVLGIFITGNVLFHLEAALHGTAEYGTRIGIAAAIGLVMLIGGRIIPSFTHNWLSRRGGQGPLPRPFSRFDGLAIAAGAIALALWAGWPNLPLTGGLLALAGVLHVIRLARWAGHRTAADRLVLILHVGYSFVPLGFLLMGAAAVWPHGVPLSAAIHAWTAGAIAIMTLAVMTRAILGHTGRALAASRGTEIIYALAIIAAVSRVAASFGQTELLLHFSVLAWTGAFGGFLLIYGPMLVRARIS